MGNWPASATLFAQLLERKDMNADDKIEACARRGFAQFQLKDLDTAERTFSSALYFFRSIEKEERLQTDFYLGLVAVPPGADPARAVPGASRCGCRRSRWPRTWTTRRACCCPPSASTSRRSRWATRSGRRPPGYQVGSLYEEFYDSFIHAPIPPELIGDANQEKREVYYEELRKKIRILLEKSLRTHEQNLLMLERLGVQNEWRDKSKLAFAKLQKMLDPSYKFDFADPATAGSAAAPPPPPTRAPPAGGGPEPGEGEPDVRDPKPIDSAGGPRAPDSVASATGRQLSQICCNYS